jgi:predicted metal-dependent hydrolase
MNVRKLLSWMPLIEAPRLSRGETLDYRIIRSRRRRRTITLSVENNGRVVVRAPARMTSEAIGEFVEEREHWINRKLDQIRQQRARDEAKGFLSGDTFLYLGEGYPLSITRDGVDQEPLSFVDGEFRLQERAREKAKDLFVQWYKQQAVRTVRQRIDHYREKLQVTPRGERITSAKCQWGGCSAQDTLTFSWRLMMAPLSVVDYVVVHELAHLRERNHSSRFWKIVEQHLPDYRDRRKWLREHGHLLTLSYESAES